MNKLFAAIIIGLIPAPGLAQVNDIKTSSSNYSSRGNDNKGSNGSFLVDIMFNIVFGQVINTQQQMLERRSEVPSMISLDIMLQSAVQPSGYYLVNPRIRANWALFSTDFRFNYLIEEGIDNIDLIRTDDWQVLQLNLVKTRDTNFRIGGGIMHEAFSGGKIFGEWTAALHYHPMSSDVGGVIEYRSVEIRKEISAFAQYSIFNRADIHGFLTGGAVYQKYYSNIAVWGVQGGVILKVY